ncbi:uncharacterized protein LOC128726129 [Anopheles nili]|uniref:uncharacterized protein LOC128726129 n=1 Tax=Anopheles nili TaxID=185578 RepID=UPI00237A686E|nr:uncharacterized protein LOC128726129 [Anopheles nili]
MAHSSDVTISEKLEDNRAIIEIVGKEITVSKILSRIEQILSTKSAIVEVRFVAGLVLNIDANLVNDHWHGRNIVVLANEIIISDASRWNVSGKANDHTYTANAGTATEGHGLPGKDGHRGESGGNVYILANKIDHPERLIVVSNGGKGSTGQSGGNGVAGVDGVGISKEEFVTKFPPCARSVPHLRFNNICDTVHRIERQASNFVTKWAEPSYMYHFFSFFVMFVPPEVHNYFYEADTHTGHKITFSLQGAYVNTNCQCFLLYKGSPGTSGKPGGKCGLGGQGGFPGDIVVERLETVQPFDVKKERIDGADGEDGRGGLYGRHGKHGWDMGYMDYSFGDWPKYFGEDKNSKLSVEYYENNGSDRVYCPYMSKIRDKSMYAKIVASRLEHPAVSEFEERNNTKPSREREHHAVGVRQKTISKRVMLDTYSEYLNRAKAEVEAQQRAVQVETTIAEQNQRPSDVANTKDEQQSSTHQLNKQSSRQTSSLGMNSSTMNEGSVGQTLNNEASIEIQYQANKSDVESEEEDELLLENEGLHDIEDVESEYQAQELVIRRVRRFTQDLSCDRREGFVTLSTTSEVSDREADVEDRLKSGSMNLNDWLRLKQIVVDQSSLNQLVVSFATVKAHFNSSFSDEEKEKIEIIQRMLLQKHKLIALQIAAQQQPSYYENVKRFTLTSRTVSKYLKIESNEEVDNESDASIRALKKCLLENDSDMLTNVTKMIKEKCQSQDECFQRAIETYILESGASGSKYECVTKYYDEFVAFLNTKIDGNEMHEVLKTRRLKVLHLWIERIDNESFENELKEMVRRYDPSNALIESISNLIDTPYQWESCAANAQIQKTFYEYIQKEGILSKSFRRLMSHVLDVNVHVYGTNEDNEYILQENYSVTSSKVSHILARDGEFFAMEIDGEFLRLDEERLHKDGLYARILHEIETLGSIEEINEYLNRNDFENPASIAAMVQEFDEKVAIEHIAAFFSGDEHDEIKRRLENVTFECTGQYGILRIIHERFSCEGKHSSYNAICFIINSILGHLAADRQERHTFAWMLAANAQRNWVCEAIILLLENRFKRQLPENIKWRELMTAISNKDVLLPFAALLESSDCFIECVGETLHLLSSVPIEQLYFDGLKLSEWPYMLKEHYWCCKLKELVGSEDHESLSSSSYYFLTIENTFGKDYAEKILEKLTGQRNVLTADVLSTILGNFHAQKWILCEDDINALEQRSLDEWISAMEEKYKPNLMDLNITQLSTLVTSNANTSDNVKQLLPVIVFSIHHASTIAYIASYKENDIRAWVEEFNVHIRHAEILAVIDRAIELKRSFRLRDTQRLTVMALFENKRSTLAQVSTGEGKSLIVVAVSIMKCLLGQKVDVITSSSVLAKRDATVNKDIYGLFGIKVSHNSFEKEETRKEVYSMHQVVYGDLSSFQRDYLSDRCYGKNMLGDRDFSNAIVDEVDSMLLDKGNNILYLSHEIAGMDKLESVYVFIWQMINRPSALNESIRVESIKAAVLGEIFGVIAKEDLKLLDSKLNDDQMTMMWDYLVKAAVINPQGKLLIDTYDRASVEKLIPAACSDYRDRLSYFINQRVRREKQIQIPNYLKTFVERHLDAWIDSAINAYYMNPDQYYVVDVDRTGTTADRHGNIIIIDRDTGTDQACSQWDEGLHQFLQLKHGCKLSTQSLKAVFISNVTYFKKYKRLYGLTGTLGSKRERNLLEEIHEVDFVTIPPAKSKQFDAYDPIICSTRDTWIETIRMEVDKLIEIKKRSVLLICETLIDVESLYIAFAGKNVHKYVRDYEEFDVAQGDKKLEQGKIIIATNLAGRGTDIQISDELKKAGGLHVCLTYLPANIRIEDQAFGRSARSGDQGSGQMIILIEDGKLYGKSKIYDLKKKRDENELYRISDIKAYYDTTIKTEERCFDAFNTMYGSKRRSFNNTAVPHAVQEILLQSCLDKWAFWLDEHSGLMGKTSGELKHELDNLLSSLQNLHSGEFINTQDNSTYLDENCWLAWVQDNPLQIGVLAQYLSKHDQVDLRSLGGRNIAIHWFSKIIKAEPHFSEAAHYYRAFALSKNIDWEKKHPSEEEKTRIKEFKNDLREADKLFEKHSLLARRTAGIIGRIEENSFVTGYVEQKQSICDLYALFSRSIQDILGHAVHPQLFKYNDINQEMSRIIFRECVDMGIIRNGEVRKPIPEAELQAVCLEHKIPVECLSKFLSKHAGTISDERQFQTDMQTSVPLPGREEFWRLLVEENVLTGVEQYVVVDGERLEAIDPSLKDFIDRMVESKKLSIRTIKCGTDQIALYHEQLSQPNANGTIFSLADFTSCVGKRNYELLVKRNALTFNETAHVEKTKLASCKLASFDTISALDIIEVGHIAKADAELILVELVEQQVLEKINETYRLKNGLFDHLLPSYPVYESVVKNILLSRFAYRLALTNLSQQLDEEKSTLCIGLKINPHRLLFTSLLEQKIIKPPIVMLPDGGKKLKEKHKEILTSEQWQERIASGLGISAKDSEKLFLHLVRKKWFTLLNNPNELCILIYSINSKVSSREEIEFQLPMTASGGPIEQYNIARNIAKFFEMQLLLREDRVMHHISSVLRDSKAFIKSLKVPKCKLTSICVFYDNRTLGNAAEIRIFILNGMEHVVQLEEKRWTTAMLLNTTGVVLMGVGQIIAGAVIEVYSAGLMTHVGAGCISEGVNDILYSIGLFKSGHFSWEEYGQQKIKSIAMSVVCAGVGMWVSRGTKLSRISYKAVGPGLEVGKSLEEGQRVAEMAGNKMLVAISEKVVFEQSVKRVIIKTSEGFAYGLASMAVDKLIESQLQTVMDSIARSILSGIENEVSKHAISTNLRLAYEALGEKQAKTLVNKLTDLILSRENSTEQYLSMICSLTNSVMQGVGNALNKIEKSKSPNTLISRISKTLKWIGHMEQIYKIYSITGALLNCINLELKHELEKLNITSQTEAPTSDGLQERESFDSFQSVVVERWKSILTKNVGRILAQHFVSPVLKQYAYGAVALMGRTLKEYSRSLKEAELERTANTLIRNKHELEGLDMSAASKQQLTEQYNNELLNVQRKTRNAALFANIVDANVPLDFTCLSVCPLIIQNVLMSQGIDIPGVKISVSGDTGVSQQFCTGTGGPEITLQLKGNHFTLGGSDSDNNVPGNNCMIGALMEAIPQLRASGLRVDEFRRLISNSIRTDPAVQHHIRNRWHKLPIQIYNAYGGAKSGNRKAKDGTRSQQKGAGIKEDTFKKPRSAPKRVNNYDDDSSSITDTDHRASDYHLDSRTLHHTVRFAGELKRLCAEYGLDIDDVIKPGASVVKDKGHGLSGPERHKAHVLRFDADLLFLKQYPKLYDLLTVHGGHTQKVPKFVNEFHRIGGDIDVIQVSWIKKLACLDFSKGLDDNNRAILEEHRQDVIAMYDKHIKSENNKYSIKQQREIQSARDMAVNTSIEDLYERGLRGNNLLYDYD